MGLLDKILESDAAAFADPDVFGESVVITLRNGTTRTVSAVVDRREPEPMGNGYRPKMFITFRNSATLGLLASEIDGGGTITVTVAYPYGAAAKPHQIHRRVDENPADAGMVTVEVG